MLIVFDRLFGTFAAERGGEKIRYGLVNRPPEFNPVKLALREWIGLFKDLRRADCIRSAVATFLLPP
ncbi:MAG TPA: hypothetical protein VHI52_22730 [Verrucomicrobiae bacterium]|nr:hypothetical protein [Verrucomicrobiae bacterium]